MDWQKEALDRRREVEHLKEQVRYLREMMHPMGSFSPEWKLAAREEEMLRAFVRNGQASLDLLMDIMGQGKTDYLVKQYAHRLRRKLAPFGIALHNIHGQGYYLDKESKQRLDAAFQPALRVEN